MKKFNRIILLLLTVTLLSSCQPTPESATVQNKSGSLIGIISGDYGYEPENVTALSGQTWSEQVYKAENINVTVNAQIVTQDADGYPAVRVQDDKEKFLNPPYFERALNYFFEGRQPYYRTLEPTRKECEMRIFWLEQAISAGRILDSEADLVNEELEYYKSAYTTAPEDIPFDIEKDPDGKKYLKETGMDNRIVLVAFPVDGFEGIDISKDQLAYVKLTSEESHYYYEVGLSSLDDIPESVHMDAGSALKIAEDSVSAIAAGEDMKLVRIATINKASMYTMKTFNYQYLEPGCLVFYFMKSYDGVRPTYFIQSDEQFNPNGEDPQYGPGARQEYIRVVVDGSDIAEWIWLFPSTTMDIISDDVPLMPFDEIKDIFRQQVKNRYAYYGVHGSETMNIDKIVLGLMKIYEKDNIGANLVVPVWDFVGTKDIVFDGFEDGGNADYTFLTVNAIDGSVINRDFGY